MRRPGNRAYSRREFLRAMARAGAGLSTMSLWGCGGGGGGAGATETPGPPDTAGYRALVGVFLFGGNDAYNMLVPTSQAAYDRYAAARLNLAVPRTQLLALAGAAADGASYGLNPSCPELQGLFNNGTAALMANVGGLTREGTQRSDYTSGGEVPPRLFSHNDQQDQWQTAHPDVVDITGWAGRAADALSGINGASELPLNLSLAGANLIQRGAQTNAFSLSAGGAQQLGGLADSGATAALRAAFDGIRGSDIPHLFESTVADITDRGIRLNELLAAQLDAAPTLATVFPAENGLADQLAMVAKLISIRQSLSTTRQFYFVSLGGWDTHDNQLTAHPALLAKLSQALKSFYDATVELGVADRVTTFTMSDFGRSLTVNGKGTDHGWSSHHWVLGGAVRGGTIYGMPPSLAPDSNDDTRGGRFIPSTAVDQYAATLVRWLGVPDTGLDAVFPNLGRFTQRDVGFMG
jgi:uncharacterized protein (DUF1501 family)